MRRYLSGAALLLALIFPCAATAAPTITHYTPPQTDWQPQDVALGGDGNVWFTELQHKGIGRITPIGTISEFTGLADAPAGIATGPSGELWFTEKNAIGRITTGGFISEFTFGLTHDSAPTSIVKGPDGNLWFTEPAAGGAIGRISPSGSITEFRTGLTTNSEPRGITAGPDGNLWFTEKAGRIGRITTQGQITEFTAGIPFGAQPQGITAGPDGNLWFTQDNVPARIGRITAQGQITEFSALLSGGAAPRGITAARDGNLYFAESGSSAIGSITTAGAITEYPTGVGTGPTGITTGSDGNLWYADLADGTLGRMTVAPGVTTVTASNVTDATADVSADIAPNTQATNYHFEYGTNTTYGNVTATVSGGSGSAYTTRTASIGALTFGTTYHVRAVAVNGTGTTFGPDHTFRTTMPGAPVATSGAASGVTSSNATLAATINARGVPTSYHFDWGTTTSYGNVMPQPDRNLTPVDAGDHAVSEFLAGLEPNKTYYYRIVATSSSGTTYGDPETFTTSAVAPDAATGSAGAITDSSATVGGTVNPRNSGAGWHFDFGKSAAFGSSAPNPDAALAADNSNHAVSQDLTGLEPNTTYHYRFVASGAAGTTTDVERTFTTLAIAPNVQAQDAQNVTSASATLAGAVNPHNSDTSYRFEWGETSSYGASSSPTTAGSDNSPHAVTLPVSSLLPDTTYHYRVVATSAAGETSGVDRTFTTAPIAPAAKTMEASDVSETAATLHGRVDSNRRSTTYRFEYGPVGGDMTRTSDATAAADAGAADVSIHVAGLEPDTAYSYRLMAESAAGSAVGDKHEFKTAALPTSAPTPTPEMGTTVVASTESGVVRFRAPGSTHYTTLGQDDVIPVGSRIDTRTGTVGVVSALDGGGTQRASFWKGVFTVRQSKTGHGYADIELQRATGCKSPKRAAGAGVTAAGRAKGHPNRLWGHDNHGRYRGHGSGSVATVRGTTWMMEERCGGTYTKVREGLVAVRDLRRHVTVRVRAGHGYLAANPR